MQTWIVHTRRPLQLTRDLGIARCMGLQVFMGGVLLSALAHPLFWMLIIFDAVSGTLLPEPSLPTSWLWWVASLNFVLGFASAMLVGAMSAIRRGRAWLAPWVLVMPLYWLLISAAAYRALWQLARAPFLWEKTRHGRAGPRKPPSSRVGRAGP